MSYSVNVNLNFFEIHRILNLLEKEVELTEEDKLIHDKMYRKFEHIVNSIKFKDAHEGEEILKKQKEEYLIE
jgi:hypothetical protein